MSLIDKYLTWRKRWLENLDLPNERQKRKLERINKIFADKEEIELRRKVDKLRAGLVYKGMTFTNGKGKAIPLQDNHNEYIMDDGQEWPSLVNIYPPSSEYVPGKPWGPVGKEVKMLRGGYIIAYINGEPHEFHFKPHHDQYGEVREDSKQAIEKVIDGIRRERNGTAYTVER